MCIPLLPSCTTGMVMQKRRCILLESITSSNLALGVDGSWFHLALLNVRPSFSFFHPLHPTLFLVLALIPSCSVTPSLHLFPIALPTIFPLSSLVVLTVPITLNSESIQPGQRRYIFICPIEQRWLQEYVLKRKFLKDRSNFIAFDTLLWIIEIRVNTFLRFSSCIKWAVYVVLLFDAEKRYLYKLIICIKLFDGNTWWNKCNTQTSYKYWWLIVYSMSIDVFQTFYFFIIFFIII